MSSFLLFLHPYNNILKKINQLKRELLLRSLYVYNIVYGLLLFLRRLYFIIHQTRLTCR